MIMTFERIYWIVTLIAIFLLGCGLQMDVGVRANTSIKILDVVFNLIVIVWATIEIYNRSIYSPLMSILLYKALHNIYPLMKLMISNFTLRPTSQAVEYICTQARGDYVIENLTRIPESAEPVIYVCNHALWSLDDLVAIGAMAREDLLVVINVNPAGLSVIPRDSSKYICIIERTGQKGSGYESMKRIIKEHMIDNGKSLIVFPENMKLKTDVNKLAPFRNGVFNLAKEMDVPIVPMWINWPCQFPSLLTSTDKILSIARGGKISPKYFSSVDDLKTETMIRLCNLRS